MKKTFVSLGIAAGLIVAAANGEESPVMISVNPKSPGAAIAPDFSGLSFEASLLLPNENGVRYFRPDNVPLINLFHTLGINSLRIGGNTSDRDAKKLPAEANLDSLFAFAQAAGVKVIYCLRLHRGDPPAAAQTVKYIMDRYAPLVEVFSIGQESSAYPFGRRDDRPATERMGPAHEKYGYETYAVEWKRFADAITTVVPAVKFCGPGVHNNADWARRFMADFERSKHVALITEHLYPGGAGGKVPTPEIGRDRMLGDDFVRVCQRLNDGLGPQAAARGLPFRLEEVNNYFNGGATNVSDTFASALWGLDFMCWWAAHGAAGLNFHTGDKVAFGGALRPSKYTAFFSTTNGFLIRPLGYGIKAFDLIGHGKVVPVRITKPGQLRLTAYAVLADDQELYLTLINKEHGKPPCAATIAITQTGAGFARGQIMCLTAPDNAIAATSGETLGGAEINGDGNWDGKWQPLAVPGLGTNFTVRLAPASAAIIKLTPVK